MIPQNVLYQHKVYCWCFCWLVACLVSGCNLGPTRVTYDYEKAHAAVTLAKYAALPDNGPAPTPEPTPTPNAKCENCNGTGKVGDGRVFVPCPKCGGDGITSWPPAIESLQVCIGDECQPPEVEKPKVIETVDEPKRTLADSEAFNPDLVMYTKDWCLPCRRWKTTELDRIVKLGKRVLIMEAPEGLTIPHFVILGEGDKKIDHSGYLTTEEYRIKSAGL